MEVTHDLEQTVFVKGKRQEADWRRFKKIVEIVDSG
jgi:hypothetical protein